ncbi:MAG: sigma-70 family RNA polymerase sigma factor [Halieaceae bacterium]|jgi:RNA polymerase sigma-70 factor (ECF subfamily)|nr:sigma-70 family RNA polymerase sigma factor [Halieaceae bacterium]
MDEQADLRDAETRRCDFDAQCTVWIQAMASGDEQALNALYDATLSRVYSVALRILGDESLAEDVVSQCYFEAWNTAERYSPSRGRPLTWLLSICRNRALDEYRRRSSAARIQEEQASESSELASVTGLPDLLMAARADERLHAVLENFGEQDRQLLAMAFFRGLTHQQIAEVTGEPLGSIKSRIRRALQALSQALPDLEIGDV